MSEPRILIVEDEKIIAKDIEIRLRRMHYQVAGKATTGRQAIDLVEEAPPDLILMDIMIDGDMDGIQTASLIRERHDIPVIFLTAYADQATFERAKGSNPFGYLVKPFQERDLDLTIQMVLSKHALERQLRDSERRYRRLFETTQEGIVILSDEGRVLEANPAAERLYLVDAPDTDGQPASLTGRMLEDLSGLPDGQGASAVAGFWQQLRANGSIEGRLRLPATPAHDPTGGPTHGAAVKDGATGQTVAGGKRYLDYSAQADYLPGRHLLVLRDVTQKVRDQRQIDNLARQAAEAPLPMLRVTLTGEIAYANPAAGWLLDHWRQTALPMRRASAADTTGAPTHWLIDALHEGPETSLGKAAEGEAGEGSGRVTVKTGATQPRHRWATGLIDAPTEDTPMHVPETLWQALEPLLAPGAGGRPHTFAMQVGRRQLELTATLTGRRDDIHLYVRDVTDEMRSAELLSFQSDILEMIALGQPLARIFGHLSTRLGQLIDGTRCLAIVCRTGQGSYEAYGDERLARTANEHPYSHTQDLPGTALMEALQPGGRARSGALVDEPLFADLVSRGGLPVRGQYQALPLDSSADRFYSALCLFHERAVETLEDPSLARLAPELYELVHRLARTALERDHALSQLRRQSLAFEHIHDGIILTDMEGRITEWSPAAERILGRNKAQMLGRPLPEAGIFEGGAPAPPPDEAGTEPATGITYLQGAGGRRLEAELSQAWMQDRAGYRLGVMRVVRDVTERRRVERALSERERTLKALFDNSVQSIVMLDEAGRIVAFNHLADQWAQSLGGRRLKTGLNLSQVWPMGDPRRVRAALRRARAGQVQTLEDFVITPGDETRFLELTMLPLGAGGDTTTPSAEGGEGTAGQGPRAVCFTALDITGKRTQEQAVARTEARFRTLVQNSSDLIILVDEHGKIGYISESCQRLIGLPPERLEGQRLTELTHPRDKVRLVDALERIQEMGPSTSTGQAATLAFEFRLRTQVPPKPGTLDPEPYLSLEAVLTHQLDTPAIRALVINARDISERKQAETALKNIVRGVSAHSEEDYFDYLTENLSIYLRMPIVVTAELRDHSRDLQRGRIESLAVIEQGRRGRPISVPASSPFAYDVLTGGYLMATGVPRSSYSQDPLLTQVGAQTAIGVALYNSAGHPIGIMIVASTEPVSSLPLAESLLKIFAVRASNELERVYGRRELLASQANLTALIENTSDAIWSVDGQMELTALNHLFRSRFSGLFTDGAELGSNIAELMTPAVRQQWMPFYEQALSGRRHTQEITLSHRGQQADYEVSFNPILDEAGGVTGVSVFARDITMRKRAERDLRRSEASLSALIENTHDVIYSLDEGHRLNASNTSFRQILEGMGCQPEAGLTLPEALAGPFGQEWLAHYERALQGERHTQEITLDLEAGLASLSPEPRQIEASFNPIRTKEGGVGGVAVFGRDITIRKQYENELKQTNFELDSFVYRASHDLRAPLRSVLGLLNLVRIEHVEEQKQMFLQLAEKSINKLDTFISDLTQFSRNSRLEVRREPVDFAAIIDECLENLRYMDQAQRVEARVTINQTGPYLSDARRLSIILQNFISNAIKYHRPDAEGGSYVSLSITAGPEEGCRIIVEDNGKGIHAEYLPRIFEMFFRASEESYGSGLGLYITKQVADKLGGRIEVTSTYGQGTRFDVWLP